MSTADWARVSSDAFNAALFAYIAAMVLSFAYLAFRRTSFHTAALVVGTVGLVANGLSIVGGDRPRRPRGATSRVLGAADVRDRARGTS